jgi:hypothetical protein
VALNKSVDRCYLGLPESHLSVGHANRLPLDASPADTIVLDTLGKLYAHGHGVGGYCRACRRLFSVFCSADRVLAPDRNPL